MKGAGNSGGHVYVERLSHVFEFLCLAIINFLFQFKFRKDEPCHTVCTKEYDASKQEDKTNLDFLKRGMELNYQHHW